MLKVECWDEREHVWIDGTPILDVIEVIYWVSKWVREGQTVRVTLGESS